MLIIALLDLLVLIIVLSSLRSRLVYELAGASLLMFEDTKPGIILYSIFVLPGTIIHELSHWIVAEVLQVRTGNITILPELKGDLSGGERLGSVATERTDPIRGFLIGVAPFISGILILLGLSEMLSSLWNYTSQWWQLALIIYGIMVVGNSMMISREDRRTWPFIIILLGVITFFVIKYSPNFFIDHSTEITAILNPLNRVLGVTAVFNLVMIGGSYGLRRLIEKLTNRRIVRK